MKIWCLFSIDNEYDQPFNNLVWFSRKKPSFELLMEILNVTLKDSEGVIAIANILQDKEQRLNNTNYRLQLVKEEEMLEEE